MKRGSYLSALLAQTLSWCTVKQKGNEANSNWQLTGKLTVFYWFENERNRNQMAELHNIEKIDE